MSWYLYFALKQIFPTRGRISFFTAISVGGVSLGVMLLILVLSLMNGFGDEIQARIVETNGHIRIVQDGLIKDARPIFARLEDLPEVAAAAPYTTGMALLQSEEKMAFPYLHGIEVAREAKVVPLEKFLVAGRLDDLDDDSVLLSSGLAARLDVRCGEAVELFAPRSIQSGRTRDLSLPRSLRVAGIFQTRWDQVDGNTAICTNRFMQDVFALGAGINGIALRLRPGAEPDAMTARLNLLLPPEVRAISWQDSNRDFLYVLQLEKNVMFFLLFFIEIVAAFALAASLLILVARRTREIGLLAALGARPRELAGIFCLQGLLIGAMGTTLGLVGAGIALHYRQGLLHAMVRVLQNEAALARFRQFQDIPASPSARDFGVVILSSLIVCTLAGLLPAWRAARLKPAQALRSE